jgi:hypothetical protein
VAFFVLGCVLYLGLLSTHFDLNGITEAREIEQGGAALFSPNHMFYRPAVWILDKLLQLVGIQTRAVFTAQIVTAIFGALGLALFYWWLSGILSHQGLAFVASLSLGTSWSYWVFSTDAYYMAPAAVFVILAFILIYKVWTSPSDTLPTRWIAASGIATAAAILFWQANVFFLPAAILALWGKFKQNRKNLSLSVLVFLVAAIGSVGIVFLVIGFVFLGQASFQDFFHWALDYGGPQLPMWGKWGVNRLGRAFVSGVSGLIPLWEGLGLRELLHGKIQIDKILPQLSLAAIVLLTLIPLNALARKRFKASLNIYFIFWLLLVYFCYLMFIVWWDPYEPKWFLIPNISLITALAIFWDSVMSRARLASFALLVFLVAGANFSATVWPRHAQPDPDLQRAQCVANHMNENDLFITADWKWSEYLDYFYQRHVYSLVGASVYFDNKDKTLNSLQEAVDRSHQNGGLVYMIDVNTYPPDYFNWLSTQMGLSKDDLLSFERRSAFMCNQTPFVQIVRVK